MTIAVEASTVNAGASGERTGNMEHYAREWLEQPVFLNQLCGAYLPQITELHTRLSGSGTRVADVGCGVGWSAITIARAYPGVTVTGFDLDAPSIDTARRNAAEAGMADRVHFTVADISRMAPHRPYDAVFAFECLHDLPDPVGMLASMHRLTGPGGIVIVPDERAEDRLATVDGSRSEQLLYGYTLICHRPAGTPRQPATATVTVLRADTLTDYATRAGFSRVEELSPRHDRFDFYRLHP